MQPCTEKAGEVEHSARGKACQALSVWEEALTNKGTALTVLPSTEEMVTVTWQMLFKGTGFLIPQGHPSHLWTVTSAVRYDLPYITYASAIINTSQSTEMITI